MRFEITDFDFLPDETVQEHHAGDSVELTPEQLAQTLDLLDVEKFDSDGKWFPLLCASHQVTSGAGLETFLRWSLGDPEFGNQEAVIRTRWRSLRTGKNGNAGAGTLRHALLEANQEIPDFLKPSSSADFESVAGNEPSSVNARQWPILDSDCLYGITGDFVDLIGPHSEADPVAILVQMLIAFGNMAGRHSYYLVEGTIRHYPNESAVLVGATAAGRKGTSWEQVKSALKSIDDHWMDSQIISGLSSGEGLVTRVQDPPAGVEEVPSIDKNVLVVESEFSSALAVMAREGNNLSAIIRNGWDGTVLEFLTKNRPLKASNAHISIVGHITADELHRRLTSTDASNGFANRILWTCVKRSKCLPEGGNINEVDFRNIQQRLIKALRFARNDNRIALSPKARTIWHAVYPELSEGKPGLLGHVISRAIAHTVRLALLYALLDRSPDIKEQHLRAALALWKYCEDSARYIFGDRLGNPTAEELLAALRATGCSA